MDKHPHAAAIDRIGRDALKTHFNIGDRAIQKWRAGGVPEIHWNTIRLIAAIRGVSASELDALEAERRA